MDLQHTQPLNTSVLYNAYKQSQKRLFLFDYDVSFRLYLFLFIRKYGSLIKIIIIKRVP